MRISDWSSDVCSSDLIVKSGSTPLTLYRSSFRFQWPAEALVESRRAAFRLVELYPIPNPSLSFEGSNRQPAPRATWAPTASAPMPPTRIRVNITAKTRRRLRSEEHTSELQSLMRISYAVFCLKKKKQHHQHKSHKHNHYTTTNATREKHISESS